jgi:hypothetical protein
MAKLDTYLQTATEFGGTLHGPLVEAEIRIGSADDNRIRVPAALGVEPQHVRLQRVSLDTFYLVPVERSAVVWLYRAGQPRPSLVRGPTVIRAGDGFSLCTPEGIRFEVVQREGQRPKTGAGGNDGGSGGSNLPAGVARFGAGLQNEVRRRGYAVLLSSWIGQSAQRIWFFVKTGQFMSPVYIMSFLVMASGWVFGSMNCRGVRVAKAQVEDAEFNLKECKLKLGDDATGGAAMRPFDQLVADALVIPEVKRSLGWGELQEEIKEELRVLLARDRPRFPGWYEGSGTPYHRILKALEGGGFPPEAARMLAWSGVLPAQQPRRDDGVFWSVRAPQGGDEFNTHCVRGPMLLSYRQAFAIGLEQRMDDAYFSIDGLGGSMGESRMAGIEAEMLRRRQAIGDDSTPRSTAKPQFGSIKIGLDSSTTQCVFRNGDDHRDSLSRVAAAMVRHLGPDAPRLPPIEEANGLTGRVALLYTMDLKGGVWKQIKVQQGELQAAFDQLRTESPDDAAYVVRHTAKVIARAVALPCLLALESEEEILPVPFHDNPPSFEACAVLRARVEAGRL